MEASQAAPSPVLAPATLFDLTGRTVVVTGASAGLGQRFARVAHEAGADVVVAARRADRLADLASSLPGALAVACEVGDADERRRLIDATLEQFGRVDVLINNAGTSNIVPAEMEDVHDFRRVMEVNLTGVFHLSQLAAHTMFERGSGVIVNVASIHGLVASAPLKQASYNASKSAVVGLTRELAWQWADKGVRVNALAPGYFPSEMTKRMWDDKRSLDFVARNTALGRGGREHELDGAILFLASDASSYMTGTTLVIDGGWTSR